ncbi:MAG: M48 family metallopeptidase [Magnetococcales bacterium]|nr:M48 family metallopeptidase [Magnetococcales bacterium]
MKSVFKLKKKDAAPRCGQIVLHGQTVEYRQIKVSTRKRMTVMVTAEGSVEVRTPLRVSLVQVEQFLQQCAQWVLNRLSVVNSQIENRSPLESGVSLPFLGKGLILQFDSRPGESVNEQDGVLWVPAHWLADGDQLKKRLELWFRAAAKKHLRRRLSDWSQVMGVHYNRLTVRDQKTRWGSCSTQGNISLNWRLIWLASEVVDYVVIHELSHLSHMDHSPAFWRRVGQFEPNHLHLRARLRRSKLPW